MSIINSIPTSTMEIRLKVGRVSRRKEIQNIRTTAILANVDLHIS